MLKTSRGDRRQGRLGYDLGGDRLHRWSAEKDETIRKAVFNDELHAKELYEKIECVGIEDVDGKPAYKLVLTAKRGKTKTEYYDKTSHLLVKEATTAKSPMGEIHVETFPTDYKKSTVCSSPSASPRRRWIKRSRSR